MVVSGVEGPRNGHTCGAWSRKKKLSSCVSGVSRRVSGVIIMYHLTCELCVASNATEVILNTAFRIFLQSKKLSSRLTKYTMDQCAGE